MTSFMICSRLIALLYAASGFNVEWAWFFSLIFANNSKSAPPYLWPYSIPICAIRLASIRCRFIHRPDPPHRSVRCAPTRHCRLSLYPLLRAVRLSEFFDADARPMSTSPALTAMMAVRSGGTRCAALVRDVVGDTGLTNLLVAAGRCCLSRAGFRQQGCRYRPS